MPMLVTVPDSVVSVLGVVTCAGWPTSTMSIDVSGTVVVTVYPSGPRTVTTAVGDDAVTASPGARDTAATVPATGLVRVANGSRLCASVTLAAARSIAAWSATIVAAV